MKVLSNLSSLLFPLVIELNIESELAIGGLYILTGIISLILFIYLSKRYLNVNSHSQKPIYLLFLANVVLLGLTWAINNYIADFMYETEAGINDDNMKLTSKYVWSKSWSNLFSITALIFLFWNQRKTVVNMA